MEYEIAYIVHRLISRARFGVLGIASVQFKFLVPVFEVLSPVWRIVRQNGQNLNNTFYSVSRDRGLLAAFLKESWRLYGKVTVFFSRFEQPNGTR